MNTPHRKLGDSSLCGNIRHFRDSMWQQENINMGSARDRFLVLFLKVTSLSGVNWFELVFSPLKLNIPTTLFTHPWGSWTGNQCTFQSLVPYFPTIEENTKMYPKPQINYYNLPQKWLFTVTNDNQWCIFHFMTTYMLFRVAPFVPLVHPCTPFAWSCTPLSDAWKSSWVPFISLACLLQVCHLIVPCIPPSMLNVIEVPHNFQLH